MFGWKKSNAEVAAHAAAAAAPAPQRSMPCLTVGQLIEQLQKLEPGATCTALCESCDQWSDVTEAGIVNGWVVVRIRPR